MKGKIVKVFLKPVYPRISTGSVDSEEDQAEFQEGPAGDGVTVEGRQVPRLSIRIVILILPSDTVFVNSIQTEQILRRFAV